jgi:excinuclease UvrABC nuclease subunit
MIYHKYKHKFIIKKGWTHSRWVNLLIRETDFIYNFHYSKLKEKAKRSGLYFLFKNSNLVYIGASHNIFTRVQSHDYSKEWDYAELYLTNENPFLIEYDYIKKYQPKYNKNGK